MKNYILINNAANGILSDIIANTKFRYTIQGNADIEKDDNLIVYHDEPINRASMILKTTDDSKGDVLFVKKIVEFPEGVAIEDIDSIIGRIDEARASVNNMAEISHDIYENICNRIISNIKIKLDGKETENSLQEIELDYCTKLFGNKAQNRIYFGAPGTGKSHDLEEQWINDFFEGNEEEAKKYCNRITFYQDYSYASFVGTYKPTKNEKGEIDYEYVPGPFIITLFDAVKSVLSGRNKPYLLLIEEINRANAAAVFGDMFQLLDRNGEGVSSYDVKISKDLKKYLSLKLEINENNLDRIKIPDNMFIWATMNSADQGVFPLDTAFKRRWEFRYLGIDNNSDKIKEYNITLKNGKKYNWNEIRCQINNQLSRLKINEDKLIGPFFIPEWKLKGSEDEKLDAIKDKVIMYLFEDAAKQRRTSVFTEYKGRLLYSDLCTRFDGEEGISIFCKEIVDGIKEIFDNCAEEENKGEISEKNINAESAIDSENKKVIDNKLKSSTED